MKTTSKATAAQREVFEYFLGDDVLGPDMTVAEFFANKRLLNYVTQDVEDTLDNYDASELSHQQDSKRQKFVKGVALNILVTCLTKQSFQGYITGEVQQIVDDRLIDVILENIAGDTIHFTLNPNENVKSLKERMEAEASLPQAHQSLFFNGQELDDFSTLHSNGIQNLSILKLKCEFPEEIHRYYCNKNRLWSLDQLIKLDPVHQSSADNNSPFFVNYNGVSNNPCSRQVRPHDFISSFKDSLQQNYPTRMVCSSLMRDSCVLEDDKTFFDYQIESRTTLKAQYLAEPEEQMSPSPPESVTSNGWTEAVSSSPRRPPPTQANAMKVQFIPFSGAPVGVEVQKTTLIGEFKKSVMSPNLPFEKQVITEMGRSLDDTKSFEDNQLSNLATLKIENVINGENDFIKVMVHFDPGNLQLFFVPIVPSITVGSLKYKIMQQSEVPQKNQVLIYNGQVIDGNHKTLDSCKVNLRDQINCIKSNNIPLPPSLKVPITIKTLTGKRIPLLITPLSTILSVKLHIMEQEGIPDSHQRLVYAGQQLDGSRLLFEYNIGANATLHLVLSMGI